MSGWLSPAFGGELRLAPDIDAVEALSPEREALWARVGRAEFLTDDEKRAAVGYGGKPEGGGAVRRKYNPYHDDRGRFDFAPGGPKEQGPRLAQNTPPRDGRPRNAPALTDATPGQQIRLSTSRTHAEEAIRRVQELDPTWRPTPSLIEGVEGQIARNNAEARQAEARLAEVLPRGFGSYGTTRSLAASYAKDLKELDTPIRSR